MTQLVESKLIDNLARQRNEFIELYSQAIFFHKKALELSFQINNSIPTVNSGYIDCFDTVFYSISSALGETMKSRSRPKESSLLSMSDKDINKIVTRVVDGEMWIMLFNRLGLFKNQSTKQQETFKQDCKTEPQEFTLNIIEATLESMYTNREPDLMNALYDTFNNLNAFYSSNNKRQFNKKVIIEGAFHEYGSIFRIYPHEPLETLLMVVWRWVLVNRWQWNENGMVSNSIMTQLSDLVASVGLDYEAIHSVSVHGIEFRFLMTN